jgi:uncharacterized protein DUF3754
MRLAEARHDQDPRGHFIPVHKGDIARALAAEAKLAAGGEAENWRDFCRLLAAIFHYDYFADLERLKEAYYYFNPHHIGGPPNEAAWEAAYQDLVETLGRVLADASFVAVPREEIERSYRTHALLPVDVYTPVEDYADIRFFRRGKHVEEVESSTLLGFRREKRTIQVYDDVVLIAAAKPLDPGVRRGQRKRFGRGAFRDGRVIIKYFRDIASADLKTLLPNVRAVMSIRDKWFLGLPAIVGGIPLLLKLVPVIAVLAVLAGIKLSAAGAVEEGLLKQSIVVMGGLLALGGFIGHQWLKYQRQSLRYQLDLADNLYFRNLNNNAGLFDAVIGAAEEQECKEALLAYFFLLGEPMSRVSLDARIEAWLRQRFACDVDFKIDDGIARLATLGLLTRAGETLSVPPLADALDRLAHHWDGVRRGRARTVLQ